MWNNPDQLQQKALGILNKLPAFQQFMKNNSQLAGLFHLPGNYGSSSTAGLAGLQTKDQCDPADPEPGISGGAQRSLRPAIESGVGSVAVGRL
ncbi:hypothetical protein ACQ86N_00555 [Puia sp. P3]|uniref:hypothetical protein n=1 Tax=Puia sp. P3 TaxID=3423952 RepID=UPI003D67EB40